MLKFKKLRGITLLELLVVIAIGGIISAVVIVGINPAKKQKQARDFTRKKDIGELVSALKFYFQEEGNGRYPANGTGVVTQRLTVLTRYKDLKKLPKGPSGTTDQYTYSYTGAGTNLVPVLYFSLESPTGTAGFWCWRAANDYTTEIQNLTACNP